MTTPILILLIAIFLFGLGGGATIWLALRSRKPVSSKPPATASPGETLPFRWSYIILPVAILLLSIALAAFFYRQLPHEVAYHFELDGSPDRWRNREITIVWMLVPQFILTLLAGAITLGIVKLGILSRKTDGGGIKPKRMLVMMGNMIALPQIILGFAMLDIFSYNAYQIHIMPLWIFTLIIMGLGAIILGLFFISVIRQSWQATR